MTNNPDKENPSGVNHQICHTVQNISFHLHRGRCVEDPRKTTAEVQGPHVAGATAEVTESSHWGRSVEVTCVVTCGQLHCGMQNSCCGRSAEVTCVVTCGQRHRGSQNSPPRKMRRSHMCPSHVTVTCSYQFAKVHFTCTAEDPRKMHTEPSHVWKRLVVSCCVVESKFLYTDAGLWISPMPQPVNVGLILRNHKLERKVLR